MQAANYLNIKSLLDLTCLTVANMIKGISKPTAPLYKQFQSHTCNSTVPAPLYQVPQPAPQSQFHTSSLPVPVSQFQFHCSSCTVPVSELRFHRVPNSRVCRYYKMLDCYRQDSRRDQEDLQHCGKLVLLNGYDLLVQLSNIWNAVILSENCCAE